MTIKLLCIDMFEEYSLIDTELLGSYNIAVYYVSSKSLEENYNSYRVRVNDFSSDSLFGASKLIIPNYMVCFSEELFVDVAK